MVGMGEKQEFTFEIRQKMTVKASCITDAVELFHRMYPDCEEKDILHVYDGAGRNLPHVYSKKTGEKILYEPGCPCHKPDCIFDPMRDVARNLSHQSCMTSDTLVTCTDYDPDGTGCHGYDDECR